MWANTVIQDLLRYETRLGIPALIQTEGIHGYMGSLPSNQRSSRRSPATGRDWHHVS